MLPLMQLEILKLWEILPHPPGTFVRWFARRGDERIGGGVENKDELVNVVIHSPGFNMYIAPNPVGTRAGIRHRAADVACWSYFLIDIDPVEEYARPEVVAENVLGLLNGWWGMDFDLRRPIMIHSGRGMQVWIRLEDVLFDELLVPVEVGQYGGEMTVSRRLARITNGFWLKRLAKEIGTLHGCRIDTTCADLPRVMRCPGTTNTKTNKPAALIVPSAERYVGLARTLVRGVPKELFIPVHVQTLPDGTSWQSVFVHLTVRAQNYLTNGRDEPGRHDTMFHTALCLAERGLGRDEVRRALVWGNERWDARHPEAAVTQPMTLQPEDIEHALDTAFRRLQRVGQHDTLDVEGDSPTVQPEEGIADVESI